MDSIEIEYSFRVKINKQFFTELKNTFFCDAKCMIKELFDSNIRRLIFNNEIVVQKKDEIENTHHFINIGGFWMDIVHTKCIESNLVSDVNEKPKRVIRRLFKFYEDGIRTSINENERNFFFEFELENSLNIQHFKRTVEENTELLVILGLIFNRHVSYCDILSRPIQISRKFIYKSKELDGFFYSPKLDGERFMCLVMRDKLVVPERNISIQIENKNQMFIGSVEYINKHDVFYLIDILYIIVYPNEIYHKLSILESINVLKTIKGIKVNTFSRNRQEIENIVSSGSIYDGILVFNKKNIIKEKQQDTVDLHLSNTRAMKKCDVVLKILSFSDGNFSQSFPEYTLENSTAFIDEIKKFKKQIYKFFIIEFKIDKIEKKISFQRFRFDKSVSNSKNVFIQMISN